MKATALMAALLITGCGTSGTSQAPVYVAGGVIGPGGGSVYLLGGPTLSIPPGALDFDLTVNLHWAADR